VTEGQPQEPIGEYSHGENASIEVTNEYGTPVELDRIRPFCPFRLVISLFS
jgi:hypothetical protein